MQFNLYYFCKNKNSQPESRINRKKLTKHRFLIEGSTFSIRAIKLHFQFGWQDKDLDGWIKVRRMKVPEKLYSHLTANHEP